MIKSIVATLTIAFILVTAVFVTPVGAQNVNDGTGTFNEAPAGGTGTTEAQDENRGFNWMWLLPLLALLLLFMMKRGNREEDRSQYRDQRFAGSKGGRSERDSNDDTL